MKIILTVIASVMISLSALAQEEAAAPAETASTEAVAVESSLIKSVAYNAETRVLTVVMVKNDETYEYSDVPERIYKELMEAESKGSYFIKNIKSTYKTVKK